VIWVAEEFRPEHVAAFEFLNQNTTADLNFFAVAVELWRIGDSPLAPKFEVVVRPNQWVKAGREQARAAATATPVKQRQQKLWIALVEALATRAPQIRPQKPQPQHWLYNSIGRSGFALNPTANQRENRLGVEDDRRPARTGSARLAGRRGLHTRYGPDIAPDGSSPSAPATSRCCCLSACARPSPA
jgi:hypothetical protein